MGGEDDLESILEEEDQKPEQESSSGSTIDDISLSEKEAKDDLESLKEDLGDIILEDPLEDAVKTEVKPTKPINGGKRVREKDLFPQEEKVPQESEEKVVDEKKGNQKKVGLKANIGTNLFEAGEDEKKAFRVS